jgi:stearoyl-CoA desaturase (delta-9 desaturase)
MSLSPGTAALLENADAEPVLLGGAMRVTIGLFVVVPLIAVAVAIPVAWGGLVNWVDIALVIAFWAVTALGITVGFHRYFTHGSFKAPRAVKIVLAVAGSMALEGPITQWVADHRKHHQFSDEVGDPHSPWRFGTTRKAIAKGLYFAHCGWFFNEPQSSISTYAPDIQADKDLDRVARMFPLIVIVSMALPAIIGGLATWSWMGALTGFFWGTLFRIAFVHHVTWSINSICHVFGTRPFKSRDLSSNVAWLAIPSFGESWHNLHHVDPTSARHGVLRGQIDITASLIRGMEWTRLVSDVRWPKPLRLAAKLKDPAMASRIRGHAKAVAAAAAAVPVART